MRELRKELDRLGNGRLRAVRLLREIYDTSSVPPKLQGKMAYITELASMALAELGEPDPRDRQS